MLQMTWYALYGLGAFGVSVLLILLMKWINVKDIPGDRSSHVFVTPRCAGVGLIGGVLIPLLGAYAFETFQGGLDKDIFLLLSGACFLGLVGFIDDVKTLSWGTRFFAQLLVCGLAVEGGYVFKTLSFPYWGMIHLNFIGLAITMFWVLGFINAFNFMDGINGLSGGVTLMACLMILIIFPRDGMIIFLLGLLACATLGFLLFNFPRAQIFLGDVGSQFLGFFFGFLGVLIPHRDPSFNLFFMPLLLFPYVFDTSFTLFRRLKCKRNLFSPHRDHLYQLLVRAGWSHTKVTMLYVALVGIQGVLVGALQKISPLYAGGVFIVLWGVYGVLAFKILSYAQTRGVET